MFSRNDLEKITDYLWEIPKSFRGDMRVPARVYASEKILNESFKDKSLGQLVNLAALPGIEKYSLVMPDVHEGYGSPIGGVFTTRTSDGVISPGAVGYDINCGVRLLLSENQESEIRPHLDSLALEIQRQVPSGLGRGRQLKYEIKELDKILKGGAPEMVRQGFGRKEDIENCEANGHLSQADAAQVSLIAKKRGSDQLGTLGSGNHFLEVQIVEEIFDEEAAKTFGVFKGQVAIMIHTGSRGLGHQIATDYIRLMVGAMQKYNIVLPDKELACAPFNSPEGKKYWSAMACGANFAWANRQMIAHYVRESWKNIFGSEDLRLLYDVAHNIAKLEKHELQKNVETELVVHRKGATRAFPPGHKELPEKYQDIGQPVLIPGSMGTASYVLVGVKSGGEAFFSACHGAGRRMSRHEALRRLKADEVIGDLENKGIVVKCYSKRGLVEEAPEAYKDVSEVVEVVHQAGLAKKVAKLVPIAVIKGE